MDDIRNFMNRQLNEAKTFKYDAKDLAIALEEIVDQLHNYDGDEVSIEIDDGRGYFPVFNFLDKLEFKKSDIVYKGKRTHKLIL